MTPLEIDKINFSWSEGVCIHSMKLYPELATDQPFIDLEKINVCIYFLSLFPFNPQIILNLQNIKVNYVRYTKHTNTLSNWLERFKHNHNNSHIDHPKTSPKKPFHLNFDIKTALSITGLSIDYQDHLLKKHILLTNTNLIITSSSMFKHPIKILLQSLVDIDHKGRFPLKFGLKIGNLFYDKNIKLENGFLSIAQNSKINWQGTIRSNLFSDLTIGPLVVDFNEMYPKIQGLLPIKLLSHSDKLPVVKVNQLQLKTNPKTKENCIEVHQGSVYSDHLTYKNNQLQLCAKKMTLNIPEVIMTQKSSRWALFCNDLSLNIPYIEFTHKKTGTINERLRLKVSIDQMEGNPKDIKESHISGLNVSFQLGEALIANIKNIDMKNKHVDIIGNASVDLTHFSNMTPIFLKNNDFKMKGQTEISLHVKGCLPEKNELKKIHELQDLNMKKNLPFLEKAKLEIGLKNFFLELKPELNFKVGPVSTSRAFSYDYLKKHGTGNLSAHFIVNNFDNILKLKQNKSLNADIQIRASHKDLKKMQFSQDLFIKNWGLKHTLKANVSGFHRLLGKNVPIKFPHVFHYLGGSIDSHLILNDVSVFETFMPGLQLKGSLNIGSHVNVIPKNRVNIKFHAYTDGIDLQHDQKMRIKRFKADLDLNKTFHINLHKSPKKKFIKTHKYLSSEVMNTSKTPSSIVNTYPAANNRFIGQFQKTYAGTPSFSFRSLHLNSAPLPIEMDHAVIFFELNHGLPHLERVQFEIWGGTVIAASMLIKKENKHFVRFQISFSGIDFNKILKNADHDLGTESEINGQLFTVIPITSKLKNLLSGLDFRLRFNRIGRLALERLLYALDPYENNEIIVSQRNLLKTGSPIWIEIVVRDGNLSMSGEISVAGLRLNLPTLKRFTITGISGLERFEPKQLGFESAYKTILYFILEERL